MKSKKDTFASMLNSLGYKYDLRQFFDDFLTLALCAFSQNPLTGKSHDENLYLETIATYAKDDAQHTFPKLLALLILEMEDRVKSSAGNDVLGEYYESTLYRKGASQYFTPQPVCDLMAYSLFDTKTEGTEPLRVLDPCCGSGRMLLSGARVMGPHQRYYGIDIDHVCVKMAAVNLFLNGIFNAEVMCANFLLPDDFTVSYAISFLPFGVFRIDKKENSRLWHLLQNTFKATREAKPELQLKLPSENDRNDFSGNVSQIKLF